MLWCPLRFPPENDVRFVFPPVSYLRCLCFVFVWCCPTHIVLCICFVFLCLVSLDCFCVVFLCLVYPMLPVSLDCFCVVFLCFTLCCQFLWVVLFWLPLRYYWIYNIIHVTSSVFILYKSKLGLTLYNNSSSSMWRLTFYSQVETLKHDRIIIPNRRGLVNFMCVRRFDYALFLYHFSNSVFCINIISHGRPIK